MRKKCLSILFVGISAALAVVASNRMSVNAIISENVEALSYQDGDIPAEGLDTVWLGDYPDEDDGLWWGPRYATDSFMRLGLPKCSGDFMLCHDKQPEVMCWY